MKKIKINTSTAQYSILLGKNILSQLKEYIDNYDKIIILSNDEIGKLYFNKFKSIFSKEQIYYFTILEGEEHKNIETVMSIYDFMIDNEFSRKSLLISLGGGVVCDIGGFTAATFMRGIDFIQIPTSLLAQVDASIGGKTAVDHPKGKNLIGAFKQPKLVLIDTQFLPTLPKEQFSSGMSEIIKHSLIIYSKDKSYFEFLKNNSDKISNLDEKTIIDMIETSCNIKKSFVEADEFETGERALLNLGHTYGHALEKLFNFKGITHGEAIAKGTVFELYLSKLLNNISEKFICDVIELFKKYNINPYPIFYNYTTILNGLKKDKKNSYGAINFILFNSNYSVYKDKVDEKNIISVIDLFKNRSIKGIIDIGTNSCRLFIAQILKNNNDITIEKEIIKLVKIVKLGEDVNKNHYLKPEAIKRTLKCLKDYKNIAESYGVLSLNAFATSATRDSSNRDEFLKAVDKLSIKIKCISGEAEATLNFKGNTIVFNDPILVVDIGGGSTEFTLGTKDKIDFIKSFNIGAVRATELFFKNDTYTQEKIDECISWIKDILKPLAAIPKEKFNLIGVAGTATTQVSVLEQMENYDSKKVHLFTLDHENIKDNLSLFLSKDLKYRKKIIGLEEKRADVIIAGTIILKTIMELLNCNKITVSESDNLNGAMITEEIDCE